MASILRTSGIRMLALAVMLGGAIGATYASESPADSARSFPRKYFLRALVSNNPATRAKAATRAKSEFAGDARMARVLADLLRQTRGSDQQFNTTIQLIGLLRDHQSSETRETFVELFHDRDPRITIAALDGLIARPDPNLLAAITGLAGRPEYHALFGLRFTVLTAVTKVRGIQSDTFLVQQLPHLEGRCEALVLRHLATVAGQDFGHDITAWKRWLDSRKQGDSLAAARVALTRADSNQSYSQKPTFFGIPVQAKRIVFVVDKSGSMSGSLDSANLPRKSSRTRAETRIERARRELVGAIAKLPADARFDIIAFDDRLAAWQPGLVYATAGNKAIAYQYIAGINARGDTAWFDALDRAMRLDGNLEAIYFLTDGEPTVGRIVSQPAIVHAISRDNVYRRITIHVIGMGVGATAEGFLKTLARASGGTYRAVGSRQADLDARMPTPAQRSSFQPRQVFRGPMPPVRPARVVPARNVGRRVADDELVLGIALDGQARAYPINMLTGPNREIINDQLGTHAIAVTWCHLCHSGIVYSRKVRGTVLVFAVSGLLWNDNLVMIDGRTKSSWSQLTGRAMRGPLQDAQLEQLPATLTDWKTWRALHPETTVMPMSRTTRVYDQSFYRVLNRFVVGVAHGDAARAWPLSELDSTHFVNDELAEQPLLITYDGSSHTAFVFDRRVEQRTLSFFERDGKLFDAQTESRWDPSSGRAVDGPLQGKTLAPVPSTPAYRSVWETFYPRGTLYQVPLSPPVVGGGQSPR